MASPTPASSASRTARIAGGFYLITVIAGTIAFLVPATPVAGAVAGASYVGVTVLFYLLFKPVSRSLSLLAAAFSFAGIAAGPIASRFSSAQGFTITMTFFGFYCVLIGYLVYKSEYLPHLVGAFLAIGGLGYLSNTIVQFFLPGLAPRLFPHLLLPGFVAETVLCLWLLVAGVTARSPKSSDPSPAGGPR